MTTQQLTIGDPAPWFEARTLAGTQHNLGVMAGRWIALCFVNDLSDAGAIRILADIVAALGRFFNDDHVIFYGVLTAPPPAPIGDRFATASHRGLGFINDESAAISPIFDAKDKPRLVVLDPMLRVARIIDLTPDAQSADIIDYLQHLPPVDNFAGVPLTAPALIVPNLFEPEFCAQLIAMHDKNGGADSGFMLDSGGKTRTVIDHTLKRRSDWVVTEPDIRAAIRDRVTRRLVPMIERFFQYRPTRMDRYLVSCYDAETGGHFARHRRFAASFNLNDGYEGCGLIFPEFGRRIYAAPCGGAIIFSTGALHQVLPITRGKRYAFVPFFYGEEEAALRLQNNAHLHEGEGLYTGENDRLF